MDAEGHRATRLASACLDDEFAAASGQYFDNVAGKFALPHADALDDAKVEQVCAGFQEYSALNGMTIRLQAKGQSSESDALFYKKPIKLNKMVGPVGLEPTTNRL